AGIVKACNQTELHRIAADRKNDGNCGGGGFCRDCGMYTAPPEKHPDRLANKIGSHGRQPIITTFRKTIFKLNNPAPFKTAFLQSHPETVQLGGLFGNAAVKESDHWRQRLLCVCPERPRCSRSRRAL